MSSTSRLAYPDICKLVAMFAITCGHCAQCISGQNWTHFLGGSGLVHAFSMPMFFLISGWFINPEKLRKSKLWDYIVSKFKRLIIPAYVWSAIFCVATLYIPSIYHIVFFNWYLKALFVCLCILIISVKLIKNDILCAFLSIGAVLLYPLTDINNVNFMFPFIWGGYFLRKRIERDKTYNIVTIIVLLIIGVLMMFDWTPEKTVYVSPFKILSVNFEMIYIYLYRFIIGFSLSTVLIYAIMRNANSPLLLPLAKYGSCTLVMYLFSFVFNGVLTKILDIINLHTNQNIVLDILSILTSIIIIILSVLISKLCRKNKWSRLLLLGEI